MNVFYGDLAAWWPLVSPPSDYEEEAAATVPLLKSGSIDVHDVLELGSGGGHNAVHLRRHFAMTLVDLSEGMLTASRALNPGCTHVRGDMRTVRLGRTFDAVFVHDAVDYMVSVADLDALLETARIHLRPGGVVVLMPDHLREDFEPGTDCGGVDAPDGRALRYLEWSYDPDPDDTSITTEYAFLLRHPDGRTEVSHETHVTGLFPKQTWLDRLEAAGFTARDVLEETTEDRPPRTFFLGQRA